MDEILDSKLGISKGLYYSTMRLSDPSEVGDIEELKVSVRRECSRDFGEILGLQRTIPARNGDSVQRNTDPTPSKWP
jgi:hypothetical protein